MALWLCACTTPTGQIEAFAERHGFAQTRIDAGGFRHTVFTNGEPLAAGEPLHVYLEGDGSPWLHRTLVMADPTPRSPLMLRLMSLDEHAAVYVGRPCYNGRSREPGCEHALWTSDRYSDTVVTSMTGTIERAMRARGASSLRLFGHSGGGTLAVLIAERLQGVRDVLTLAGNLDPDAWTDHHGYTPLFGSLNPARREPLSGEVREWHLLGGRDTVVPPPLVAEYLRPRSSAVVRLLPGYSHGCCWHSAWPAVLHAVEAGREDRLPGEPVR